MPLMFPVHLFNPRGIRAGLIGRAVSSPPSISGVGQVLRTDGGGYWAVEFSGIALNSPDKQRAWRAWEAELDGGATRVVVPVPDLSLAPRPLQGRALARPSGLVALSADPYFPEATAFATPLIVATASAAALRSTQITITVTQGSRVVGGQMFSIDHATKGRRMYQTGRVISQSGQTATVTIRPPLREAITGDTPVNFDWPAFEAIKVPESEITADIQIGRYAQDLSITFREAI